MYEKRKQKTKKNGSDKLVVKESAEAVPPPLSSPVSYVRAAV